MDNLDPRLFRGDKATALKYFGNRARDAELLLWALDVKPGEYIATCEGCNRRVAESKPRYTYVHVYVEGVPETDETQVLHEVRFTDTKGKWHHCPGGGCAHPKQTPEEVTEYQSEWAFDPEYPENLKEWYGTSAEAGPRIERAKAKWIQMRETLERGEPIVDNFGELLPQFDNNNGGA